MVLGDFARSSSRSETSLKISVEGVMNHRITIAVAAVAFAFGVADVGAQETGAATTSAKPMSGNLTSISDAMLQNAASDPKNWIHPNGNYANTRYYPGAQINAGRSEERRVGKECRCRWGTED